MTRKLLTLVVALSAAGCATAGSTLGSGVGDALLDRAPYYAGRGPVNVDGGALRTGHLPVHYQRGASHPELFDPKTSPAVANLLEQLTAYLDSLGVSKRLVDGGRVSAVAPAAARVPPDVRFGCETVGGAPGEDCVERGDSALGRGPQRLLLAVGRPSPEWTAWLSGVMVESDVHQALVITLEVGQYWTRQRGWRGTKEVELGTSHTQELPWLTSLETPVSVLQLTGALIGPDGKAIRIGAEGLLAHRTRLAVSAIGGQELISDEDILALGRARRDDLPGKPLVWQAGLSALLQGLGVAPRARL